MKRTPPNFSPRTYHSQNSYSFLLTRIYLYRILSSVVLFMSTVMVAHDSSTVTSQSRSFGEVP